MNTGSIRISASRLKMLWNCSLAFYYAEIIKLPDETMWQGAVGHMVHKTFECIMRPKRLTLFQSIISADPIKQPFSIHDYPVIVRFVQHQLIRKEITNRATIDDIGELLRVAFLSIRPHFIHDIADDYGEKVIAVFNPPPIYRNEYRFKMVLSSGAVLSGFIDLLMIWPNENRALVVDLKTSSSKFTKAELPHNIQAAIYAFAVHQEFAIIPTVEFAMLKHPPTKRTKDKHIQRVDPPSSAHLTGLSSYIQHTSRKVNQFSLEDAYANPCTDSHHCHYMCSFYKPFTYWEIVQPDGFKGKPRPYPTFLDLDKAREGIQDGETIVEKKHKGCSLRWDPNAS